MELFTLMLIAIGLTFDTFAVSISTGLVASHIRFWQATKIGIILAFFQALMPFIGWIIGTQVKHLISNYDHWVAFGLLACIGIKMIVEGMKKEEDKNDFDPFRPMVVVGMAIATSIDAFIVGISFAFISINIFLSIGIIGFFTYLVAMLGMLFGKNVGKWFGKRMEIVGGLILIGIGVKILLEHILQ
jgi:manganese efflux pump family protein